MCRVCGKRPEIPEERYGRCDACAKAGRIAFRFRLAATASGTLRVKAGELSPRALRQRWREPLLRFQGHLSVRPQLGLHELELLTARDRLEGIRVSPDLAALQDRALAAVREAADRTEAAW